MRSRSVNSDSSIFHNIHSLASYTPQAVTQGMEAIYFGSKALAIESAPS